MKALRRRGPDTLLDTDATAPEAGPGEALIRPTLTAIGPSDLAVARGEIPFEGIMGHRFVGVVEAVGEGVADRWRHARVVGNINIADATSPLARRGLGNHAPDRRVLGLLGKDGCFAERFTLPASNLAVVPDTLDDGQAIAAEPLAGAVHASRIVHLERKGFVTVIGDNLSALLCTQVMEPLNNTVRLLGRRPERFEMAERWGVRHRHIEEVGLRGDQDVVIVCTGSARDFAFAMGMVRPRGKIVLKTEPIPLPGVELAGAAAGVDLTPVIRDEIEVYGARCGSVADAISVLSSGAVDVTSLVTKRVKFTDGVAGLRAAAEPEQIVVVMEM
ncbi:MAG: alcohol dehydrogenase catalytic domain-containing protein [Phycisphaeraceae bacterium]|nr:MAG: alcohol dehydrogenase catalytic domain-containing protein [Phycisphaeraceae bacterium]